MFGIIVVMINCFWPNSEYQLKQEKHWNKNIYIGNVIFARWKHNKSVAGQPFLTHENTFMGACIQSIEIDCALINAHLIVFTFYIIAWQLAYILPDLIFVYVRLFTKFNICKSFIEIYCDFFLSLLNTFLTLKRNVNKQFAVNFYRYTANMCT